MKQIQYQQGTADSLMQNWRKEIPAYLVIKEKCSLWNIRLKMLSSAMLYTQCVNNNGKSKIESKVRIFCHFFHHKQKCRCNHLIYNGILFYSVGMRRLELPTPTSRTQYATNCATPRFNPTSANRRRRSCSPSVNSTTKNGLNNSSGWQK